MVARSQRRVLRPAADRGPALTSDQSVRPRAARQGSGAPERVRAPERRGPLVRQGDRLKAYRPIEPEQRRAALEAGIEAYARGDFFEAHELLEPAWMGTDDLAERAFYQGLIKLAAGYVHCVRGNPIGMARNLEGARRHLATALAGEHRAATAAGIDLARLLADVETRIGDVREAVEVVNARPAAMIELTRGAPALRRELRPDV